MENLIYNILAFIIVGFAFTIAAIRFYKSIKPNQKSSCDSGCGGCASKCDLKEAFHQ